MKGTAGSKSNQGSDFEILDSASYFKRQNKVPTARCNQDTDCHGGLKCVSFGGIVKACGVKGGTCKNRQDCPGDYWSNNCIQGSCYTASGPLKLGQACDPRHLQCEAGLDCTRGKCGSVGKCSASQDCAYPMLCLDGTCRQAGEGEKCTRMENCKDSPSRCLNQKCVRSKYNGENCLSGNECNSWNCYSGICRVSGVGDFCDTSTPCPGALMCYDNKCDLRRYVQNGGKCSSVVDCASANCDDGICRKVEKEPWKCDLDRDCGEGHTCRGGKCY